MGDDGQTETKTVPFQMGLSRADRGREDGGRVIRLAVHSQGRTIRNARQLKLAGVLHFQARGKKMFVKLTQIQGSESGNEVEIPIAVNTDHVIKISATQQPEMVNLVLTSTVSSGLNYEIMVNGKLDDVISRLNGAT
jgi:hypothetical protein